MTGQSTSSLGILDRQPVLAAGGLVAAVTPVLNAIWGVLHDAGLLQWLQQPTKDLVNTAILAVVALAAAAWAQRRSTPTAAPTLPSGTTVQAVDDKGAPAGTTTV